VAPYRIGSNENFTAGEIANQIRLTRGSPMTRGAIHFSLKSLRNDLGGVQKVLRDEVYARGALVPRSPWVKAARLLSPRVKVSRGEDFVRAVWAERGPGKAFWFVVYVEDKSGWSYSVLPAAEKSISLSADRKVRKVLVTAVDRLGNESPVSK
jgi:hypothetical protein